MPPAAGLPRGAVPGGKGECVNRKKWSLVSAVLVAAGMLLFFLPALLGLGFEGLWVDTYGYTDDGAEIAQIREAVGVEPLVSEDGRFLFFDLRPYRERLGMTDEQLRAETRRLLHVDPPDPS